MTKLMLDLLVNLHIPFCICETIINFETVTRFFFRSGLRECGERNPAFLKCSWRTIVNSRKTWRSRRNIETSFSTSSLHMRKLWGKLSYIVKLLPVSLRDVICKFFQSIRISNVSEVSGDLWKVTITASFSTMIPRLFYHTTRKITIFLTRRYHLCLYYSSNSPTDIKSKEEEECVADVPVSSCHLPVTSRLADAVSQLEDRLTGGQCVRYQISLENVLKVEVRCHHSCRSWNGTRIRASCGNAIILTSKFHH